LGGAEERPPSAATLRFGHDDDDRDAGNDICDMSIPRSRSTNNEVAAANKMTVR
jgi:hypothetical protein